MAKLRTICVPPHCVRQRMRRAEIFDNFANFDFTVAEQLPLLMQESLEHKHGLWHEQTQDTRQ